MRKVESLVEGLSRDGSSPSFGTGKIKGLHPSVKTIFTLPGRECNYFVNSV